MRNIHFGGNKKLNYKIFFTVFSVTFKHFSYNKYISYKHKVFFIGLSVTFKHFFYNKYVWFIPKIYYQINDTFLFLFKLLVSMDF